MAELTTIDGLEFHFDPSAVTAVADHDADTLQAVTTVYGLSDGRLRIADSAEGFLNKIGVAQSFVKLTRPNGMLIWINCKAVTVVRSPPPDQYPATANSLVTVGALTQAVQETPTQVKQTVNQHGGNL